MWVQVPLFQQIVFVDTFRKVC
jgi:hypothetical protein